MKKFFLKRIETEIQGLCPLSTGNINVEICRKNVEKILLLNDRAIFKAQKKLIENTDWIVEPAGAAAAAPVLNGLFPESWTKNKKELNVVAIVSGGNADESQIKNLQTL